MRQRNGIQTESIVRLLVLKILQFGYYQDTVKKKTTAVLSVACLYGIVTPQPKPISDSSSSGSRKILISPIHQSGTKTYILHTLASTSHCTNAALWVDGAVAVRYVIGLPTCLSTTSANIPQLKTQFNISA